MLCSGCLELTTESTVNSGSITAVKSMLNTFLFSRASSLPSLSSTLAGPSPSEVRPYGAIKYVYYHSYFFNFYRFYTPGSIDPRGLKTKKSKTRLEWLRVNFIFSRESLISVKSLHFSTSILI